MAKLSPILFYLQDSRQYIGNNMLFWRKDNWGYTSNLDEAQTFSTKEALNQYYIRNTDIPWSKDYIDSHINKVVDHGAVRFLESTESSGLLICPNIPKPDKLLDKTSKLCRYCGRFISEEGKLEIEIEGRCKGCKEENADY